MTVKLKMILLAGLIGVIGLGAAERLVMPGTSGFISIAEARVGRPLTPVSVAGVTRRTVRRCAAGVYNC
jgi:hypothetical protein